MSNDRRSFLSGLVGLPLIGGGISLIGRPTAVAVASSPMLLETYLGWLRLEHTRVSHRLTDRWGPNGQGYHEHAPAFALPDSPQMIETIRSVSPTTQAAVVLSAVGLDWRSSNHDCEGLVNRPCPSWKERPTDPFRTYPAVFEKRHGIPYRWGGA